MGYRISKSMEGVQALKQLSVSLKNGQTDIYHATNTLLKIYQGVQHEIAHEQLFTEMIDELVKIQQEVKEPVETISNRLQLVANRLEDFLNNIRNQGGHEKNSSSSSQARGNQGGAKDVMSGVSMIQTSHSREEDAKASNPNFDKNSFAYSYNCQRCVSTYEARRRGYDVIAKPTPGGGDSLSYVEPIETGVFSVYKNPQPNNMSANSGQQVKTLIQSKMKEWGDGARAIICVQWNAGGGHAFIAEQVKGSTVFIDPQKGTIGCGDYFDIAQGSGAWCTRVDDLEFTPRIKECCEEKGNKNI